VHLLLARPSPSHAGKLITFLTETDAPKLLVHRLLCICCCWCCCCRQVVLAMLAMPSPFPSKLMPLTCWYIHAVHNHHHLLLLLSPGRAGHNGEAITFFT
jgi:hypothetical protein